MSEALVLTSDTDVRGSLWTRWGFAGTAAVSVVAAVFTNLVNLSVASMTSDDPIYLHAAARYVHGQSIGAVELPNGMWLVSFPDNLEHPPIAKYLFGIAQVLLGRSTITADRAVSVLATLLTAALVFWFVRRLVGRWPALLAALLITMLPEHGIIVDSFSRSGYLEPVASMFLVAAVVLAWFWFHLSGPRAWLAAAATGVAAGLATGSKETAFLGIIGPVLLGLAYERGGVRGAVQRVTQAATAAVLAATVFWVAYLPIGSPASIVAYMTHYQSSTFSCDHLVTVDGQVYRFQPWWSNFWFAYHAWGGTVTVALLLLAAAAVILRHDRLVWWLLSSLAAPIVFHCFLTNTDLPYYFTLWTVPFLSVAALGAAALAGRIVAPSRHRHREVAGQQRTIPALAVLGVSIVLLLANAVAYAYDNATLRAGGPRRVALIAAEHNLTGLVLTLGVPVVVLREYLPQPRLVTVAPADLSSVQLVAVASPTERRRSPLASGLAGLLSVNIASGALRRTYQDSTTTVYLVVAPLVRPTAAQVAATDVHLDPSLYRC